MKRVFGIIFFAVLAFSITAQASQSETEIKAEINITNETDQNLIVSKINFTGLKKTRNSYIQSKVKKFIGKALAETDMHDFETALQLEGLFNDIKISTEQISDTEAQINVSVKEKITFIPLPFAVYSSSKFLAGAIILDTNAFGQKDMFMFGGFIANNAKTGLASFVKSPKGGGIPGFSVFLFGSDSSPEYANLDNEDILKYDDTTFGGKLTFIEKFAENFSFSNGFSFSSHKNSDDSEFKGLSPESIKQFSLSFALGYSKSDWNGIFMSTNSAKIETEFAFNDLDDSDYRHPMGFSFSISGQHPIFIDRLRMYQSYSGYYGKHNHLSYFKGQSDASVSILSGHFSSQRLAGGNAGLEFAIKKFGWGMISAYSDYQFVITQDLNPLFIDDENADYEFLHGPNGGFRFYLAKIAFPALAMGLSYNVTKNYWQFTAAMGMTF